MRFINQFIILFGLCYFCDAYANYNVFVEPLYWQATQTLDWLHTNNLNPSNVVISFKGIKYHADPGVRVGLAYEGDIDSGFYFTSFNTSSSDSATGNLTTGLLGGRISQTIPETIFYQTGQAHFKINLNTLDVQIGKRLDLANHLMLRPKIGLKAGVIHQKFHTSFQGQVLSISEIIQSNFKGIGPKAGIEADILFWRQNAIRYSIVANVEMAYMWGHWNITDHERTSTNGSVNVYVAPRNFGALEMQGMLGAQVAYKNISAKISYEMNDWFNQCQIFDDETGTQNNDLLLQGLTLSLVYKF